MSDITPKQHCSQGKIKFLPLHLCLFTFLRFGGDKVILIVLAST